MIRLTEVRLPLDHAEPALRAAALTRLGIAASDLRTMTVFKRGYDARKRSAIVLVYSVDVEVADEAAVLAHHADDPHVRATPDMGYRFVAHVPVDADRLGDLRTHPYLKERLRDDETPQAS